MPKTLYAITSLAQILAQIVHFGQDDYQQKTAIPEDTAWNLAYTCSCFLAQHTPRGQEGVDTEAAYVGLKATERMPYADRLALATALVAQWSGPDTMTAAPRTSEALSNASSG